MRKHKDLVPSRYKSIETSGSNRFTSTFSQKEQSQGIVEKRDRSYNWVGYKWAVAFTLIIGFLTYLMLDYLM